MLLAPSPAESNHLNKLWGCFSCQLLLGYQHHLGNCMATGHICAFNVDRGCRAQLLMEHSYPFSHYSLRHVRLPRPEGNHEGSNMCVLA